MEQDQTTPGYRSIMMTSQDSFCSFASSQESEVDMSLKLGRKASEMEYMLVGGRVLSVGASPAVSTQSTITAEAVPKPRQMMHLKGFSSSNLAGRMETTDEDVDLMPSRQGAAHASTHDDSETQSHHGEVDMMAPPKGRRLTEGLSIEFLSYLQVDKPTSEERSEADESVRSELIEATMEVAHQAAGHLELGRPSQIELVLPRSVSEVHIEPTQLPDGLSGPERAKHQATVAELENCREKIVRQLQANYVLEQDVRNLDEKIGLLITHRMIVEADDDFAASISAVDEKRVIPDRARSHYEALFKLLHHNPRYVAILSRQLRMSEIDDFLHSVMFTLFGNDDRREEHLLLTMFEKALKMEFRSAPDLGSLMRSNTAMSRMMTTYTRRGLGQTYLKHTLLPQINLLVELGDNVTLEIDPLKVYAELARGDRSLPPVARVTPEEALENEALKQKIEERCSCLRQMTDKFIKAMIQSLDKVPYGVRWLCKTIRLLTRSTYPEATDANIMSLIGGFFLLRYVNPAIVTPEAFGIVNHKPGATVRRNLILIAKILQSLANSAAQSKEFFMQPLNPYIKQNQPRLHAFLNELCNVDDFYEQYKMDTIGALAIQDPSISITPNEIFTVHRLLFKYREKMELPADDELSGILDRLSEPPELLPRKDNLHLNLMLLSHSQPRSRINSFSSNTSNFSERVRVAEEKRRGATQKSREQLEEELAHTKSTYKNMCDNYEYLKDKIDSYSAYLDNVRGQAISVNSLKTEFHSIDITLTEKKIRKPDAQKGLGPFHFKLTKLDKAETVIKTGANIPTIHEAARSTVMVTFAMPQPGCVQFTVRFKNQAALYHKQCNFEDILTKVDDANPEINLGGHVTLDARKTLVLLDKTIFR